jgi:long-chain acyl-CoA synthetase
MGNVVTLMRERCLATPEAPFIKRAGESAFIGYGEFRRQVRVVVADVLQHCGREERVCLYAENGPHFAIGLFALWAAGKTVVPIDVKLTPAEIAGIVQDSGASTFYLSRLVAAKAGAAGGLLAGRFPCRVLEEVAAGEREKGMVEIDDRRTAVVIYSSGTTGRAKGVCLSHHNLFHNTTACATVLEIGAMDNFLALLPLNHAFALTTMLLLPIPAGARVTTLAGINPSEILRAFREDAVSVATVVPGLLRLFLGLVRRAAAAHPGATAGPAVLGPQLRLLVSGGAPLAPAVERELLALGLPVVQGYGLSENSPVVAVNPPRASKVGTVGRPLAGVTVRIHEPNENGEGEMVVGGESVMQGYHDRPQETAEALRGGELYTGDIGRFDEEGYITICGRSKNVVIAENGKNVYPEEIEAELLRFPLFREVAVVGLPRRVGGAVTEEIVAVVTVHPEAAAAALGRPAAEIGPQDPGLRRAAEECVRQACSGLADYKRVGRTVIVAELPRTATGKVRVPAVREMLGSLFGG